MKITRYFQSCLLIEEGSGKILIDPSGQEKDRLEEFGELTAVLYTHEHSDHFDAALSQQFIDRDVPIYANTSTAKQIEGQVNVVSSGQKVAVAGFEIEAHDLPHCLMWDGSEGPQNTGYLINGRLFHPGDGKEIDSVHPEILAVPITGPDVSLKDAYDFIKQVGPTKVIPIHYDYIGTKPEVFASHADKFGFEAHVLGVGESVEL